MKASFPRWLWMAAAMALPAWAGRIPGGTLLSPAGICPLKHTDVMAEISGPLSRVTVTQEFENPFKEKIEAVYVFPLPAAAAVDDMTMLVGGRTIRGKILRREEARAVYEAARRGGRVAGLLDQERPNIFTQSVANIVPGAKVKITISYVETLPYEAGRYEFRFPMVVGPRYIPGRPTEKQGGGWAPDTNTVPDASRITPEVTPEGTRSGHDISLEVKLDAGMSLEHVESTTHEVAVARPNPQQAHITLRGKAVIPNKDFVLKYDVAGRVVKDAVLTHSGKRGGFFTLLLEPPDRIVADQVTPRELVFVLDTSGSMSGFPIEKAKEAMRHALDGLNPGDTFNLITFSGATRVLFPRPLPATEANLRAARELLNGAYGSGGTEMMTAIRAAFDGARSEGPMRVICFMTDGLVGNDFEIIAEVQRHPQARVFAFGIGQSTNHFLLDNMARYGRGEVEYVGLQDDGSAAARRFHERVHHPLLTDISIDWNGLPVSDVYPTQIPDLFSAKPVVISGRYTRAAAGGIRLRGRLGGRPFTRTIHVNLPASQPEHDVLASLWARRRIDSLMAEDMRGMQYGNMRADLRDEITRLGLDFRLMTQFTSFVAVEETVVTEGGQPRRVDVPVEMPEGLSYQGIFGERGRAVAGVAHKSAGAFLFGGLGRGAAPMAESAPMRQVAPPPRTARDAEQPQPRVHAAVAAVIERVKTGARPGVEEARFVFGGRAVVRLTLADTSPAVIERLRKLGFETLRAHGNTVSGRIAVERLAALAEWVQVLRIEPAL